MARELAVAREAPPRLRRRAVAQQTGHRKVEVRARGKGRNQHWCVSTREGEWPARYRRGVVEGMAQAMTSYKRVNPLATVYPARVVQSCEELP